MKRTPLQNAVRMLRICLVEGYGNIRNVPLNKNEIEALLEAVTGRPSNKDGDSNEEENVVGKY